MLLSLRYTSAVVLLWLASCLNQAWVAEPIYQEKTVTEWAAVLSKNPWSQGHPIALTNAPAAQAILHFGTNAVPCLIAELNVRDSKLKQEVTQLIWKQSFVRPPLTHTERHWNALGSLSVLGPLGKEAIPTLTNFLYAGQTHSQWAIWALAMMGRDAVGPLTGALCCTNSELRRDAARTLWVASIEGAEETIPALLACLEHEDFWVRVESLRALAAIGKRSELVVPAIRERLTDPKRLVVDTAEKALKKFETKVGKDQ